MTFTFQQQAEYFKKKLNIPTNRYLDVIGEEHDYFFMVAGASRNEVLLALREAVDKAIAGGTIEEFRQQFDDIVAKTGWQYKGGRNWRTRIIYDTNVYGSYNRARLQQHLDLADVMPYWEYQHNDNAHPRQEHVDLDGIIRPAKDPFWKYYYPIKAYGCHCTVIAHDEDDLEYLGKKVSPPVEIEMVEKVAGVRSGNPQKFTLPKGYDVGFEPYNFERLSQGRLANADKVIFNRAMLNCDDPKFTTALAETVLRNPQAVQILNQSVKMMTDRLDEFPQKRGEVKYVGVLPKTVLDKLKAKDRMPESAVIAFRDDDYLHAQDHPTDVNLPKDFWQKLPENLHKPQAILYQPKEMQDTDSNLDTLLFVYKTEKGKVAIKVNHDVKIRDFETNKRKTVRMNIVRTGTVITDFTGLGRFETLWGSLE